MAKKIARDFKRSIKKAAVNVKHLEPYRTALRAAYSALREAEVQIEKADKRAADAEARAGKAREIAAQCRLEVGRTLIAARGQWPARGPKAKGWGEFLRSEGIHEQSAREWMALAGFQAESGGLEIPTRAAVSAAKKAKAAKLEIIEALEGFDIRHGAYVDVLADIGTVDTIICDTPYSADTHDGAGERTRRSDDSDLDGIAPSYPPWTPEDVDVFVAHWSPRCRGWMVAMSDDVLIPTWKAAYRRAGRTTFAAIPCVMRGMSVRLRGDGPSSEAVYLVVARPKALATWGTLPGAYVGGCGHGAEQGRGKPDWLLEAIVADYSRSGDLICDPCAGYGTTLLAALKLGRRAVGADNDPKAIEEALRRASLRAKELKNAA